MAENGNKRARKSAFEIPTAIEQRHLRETENILRNNILSLQIEELMVEIKLSEDDIPFKKITNWSRKLKDFILDQKFAGINKPLSQNLRSKLSCMLLENYGGEKNISTIGEPTNVQIVGSCQIKAVVKPFLNLDLAVTISADFFEAS